MNSKIIQIDLHGTNLVKKTLVPSKTCRLSGTTLSYLAAGYNALELQTTGCLRKEE